MRKLRDLFDRAFERFDHLFEDVDRELEDLDRLAEEAVKNAPDGQTTITRTEKTTPLGTKIVTTVTVIKTVTRH